MQIDRVTRGTIFVAAIILGLLLLSPQVSLAPGPGSEGHGAVPPGPFPSPSATVRVLGETETGREIPARPVTFTAEMDPVPDISRGRPGTVTISEVTDEPPGTLLRIDFIASSMHPSPQEYNPALWFSANATVTKGEGSSGMWSVNVRPEEFKKPDRWQVLITDAQSGWSIGSGYVNVTV